MSAIDQNSRRGEERIIKMFNTGGLFNQISPCHASDSRQIKCGYNQIVSHPIELSKM
jgi:hypothetical protein